MNGLAGYALFTRKSPAKIFTTFFVLINYVIVKFSRNKLRTLPRKMLLNHAPKQKKPCTGKKCGSSKGCTAPCNHLHTPSLVQPSARPPRPAPCPPCPCPALPSQLAFIVNIKLII